MNARETRTTVQIAANQIDMDLFRLAGRIDELAEMASRGKRTINGDLVDAARKVSAARTAVRSQMHRNDVMGTI